MSELIYQLYSNDTNCLNEPGEQLYSVVMFPGLLSSETVRLLAFHELDTHGEYWPENIPQSGSVLRLSLNSSYAYLTRTDLSDVSSVREEARLLKITSTRLLY